MIRLDNLNLPNGKLPGMEWIVEEDETDKTFMRDYKLRNVVADLKKRVNDVEKMERTKHH